MFNLEEGKGCLGRNSNLVEELGQVKYVVADKTGTLTKNEMKLQMASVPT